ncbi:MAG: hypothetical protein ABI836_07185 [Gemmatimonadota bacterium]
MTLELGLTSHPDAGLQVSVLVPVWQKPESLAALYQEYARPLRQRPWAFEFVFICEPGFEAEIRELLELAERGEPIRILQVAQQLDESRLYNAAAELARGEVIVTLPGYRRIEAEQVPRLIDRVFEGRDLVLARRWPRRDAWINKVQNRVLHWLIRWTLGGTLRDVACGVRAMRREVLLKTPVYGDSFRFFALFAGQAGFESVEIDTPQHPGDRRARFYRPGLYFRRLVDLLGLFVILRFTSRPLRFFGPVGMTLISLGLAALVASILVGLAPVGGLGRIMLLTGIFLIVLGVQAIAIGLIGEMMVFLQAPQQTRYRIVERLN